MALRDQPYLPLYIQDIMTDEKLNRKAFGFEIKKPFYKDAIKLIEKYRFIRNEINEIGYAKTELNKSHPTLF